MRVEGKLIRINGTPWSISPELRTGQWLFNNLPVGAQMAITGMLFDPFYKELTGEEIEAWLDNHTIRDNGEVIAIIYRNKFLWEKR